MRNNLIVLAIGFMLCVGSTRNAYADLNISLTADDSGIREFHLAIGDHYKAPEKDVVLIKKRGIPDDDLPVVFYLARRASVSPGVIVDLRLGGKSWIDISFHYGLSAEIYYVEVREAAGPPYGKALGHFKNKPKRDWKHIRLTDNEIVNLVNLKFISAHYGYSSDEIIKMRSKGENFAKINAKLKKAKAGKKDKSTAKLSKGEFKAKAKKKKK